MSNIKTKEKEMHQFKPIDDQDIQYFKTIVEEQFVSGDPEVLKNYSKDETPDETLRLLPEVVIKPTINKEIQLITRYCFEKNIAITPRGSGQWSFGWVNSSLWWCCVVFGENEPDFRNRY